MSEQSSQTADPEDHLGMTDEQWAWFQTYTHGFGEQDENGVDVSLLRENLRLTPSQRVEQLQRVLDSVHADPATEPQHGLRFLVASLRDKDVRHIVIGGWAMSCYGFESHACDLDLHYGREAENLTALAEVLTPLHPRLRGLAGDLPFQWNVRTLRGGINFMLVTDAGDVDLLGSVPGVDSFQGLWERSSEMELFGVPVRVASLNDLIVMKRAAGRVKDQLHLLELERLRRVLAESKPPKLKGE
jgi:predicted nucleotidyltransferase